MGRRNGSLEDMVNLDIYRGRRVLVTGHTGFKGAWLCAWLKRLGARVTGLALEPECGPQGIFEAARIADDMVSHIGDIRDPETVRKIFGTACPEIVFHLAAQALVRPSYTEPLATFSTNVMGTAHILDAARRSPGLQAIVIVTSDKCYENHERLWGYREDESMGGSDPYSASKGCAELVTSSFRRSFFNASDVPLVASARAGNVIGGGDWATDRLVPDIARAILNDSPVILRNPDSVRPWQHVLEPLRGYLMLGARLLGGDEHVAEAWNFGPLPGDALSVREIAARIVKAWNRGTVLENPAPNALHEAGILRLDITKAIERLGYRPILGIDEAVSLTASWYGDVLDKGLDAAAVTAGQIDGYMDRLG